MVILAQALAVILSLALILYGRQHAGETIANAVLVCNCMGFSIKFIGALLYARFSSRRQLGKAGHFLIWLFAVLFGAVLGTEIGMVLAAALIGSHPPRPFTSEHVLMLGVNLFMVIPPALMIFTYIVLRKRYFLKLEENRRMMHLQTRTKLAALQARVNPHFLFNTLNAMLTQVYKAPDKVEKMILTLSDIYRKVLTLPEDRFIPLEEEIQLVREYLEIEKIRMGERLSFSIDVQPGLESFKIAPLLIEPLVENAVIHGIGPKPEGGTVQIDIWRTEGKVEIVVADDGVGIDKKHSKAGFGLNSIQERLALSYKEKAVFSIIQREGGGIRIKMELPDVHHEQPGN
jgi:two-component sensor histidine kinase